MSKHTCCSMQRHVYSLNSVITLAQAQVSYLASRSEYQYTCVSLIIVSTVTGSERTVWSNIMKNLGFAYSQQHQGIVLQCFHSFINSTKTPPAWGLKQTLHNNIASNLHKQNHMDRASSKRTVTVHTIFVLTNRVITINTGLLVQV